MKIKPKTEPSTFADMDIGALFYLDGVLYNKIQIEDRNELKMRYGAIQMPKYPRDETPVTVIIPEDWATVLEVQTRQARDLAFGDIWWYNTDISYCYVKLEGDRSLRLGSAVDWEYESNKDKEVVLLELANG
jgi:hypothetical protein